MRTDTSHAGIVVGEQVGPRIVALSTAAVFSDPGLLPAYWDTDAAGVDNGIQAHLYTRSGDVLVIQLPAQAGGDASGRIGEALDANAEVWRRHAGIDLVTSRDTVVTVPPPGRPGGGPAPVTMDDVVVSAWAAGTRALLGLVLSPTLLDRLHPPPGGPDLRDRVRTVARLMDKNVANGLLARAGVPVPPTLVHPSRDGPRDWARLPAHRRYVFKPARGAAGIGVFPPGGRGTDPGSLARHISGLRAAGILPDRYQVQEFLPGPLLGAWVWLDGAGGARVLEVHRQVIDDTARFLGARWTPAAQAAHLPAVQSIAELISGSIGHPLHLGIDLIGRRVIEVNPRLTAATPIAHLIRNGRTLARCLPAGRITRIDLDVRVPATVSEVVPAVERVLHERGALVLPQGIDPWGNTRVLVVNDDETGTARAAFTRLVAGRPVRSSGTASSS